MTSLGESQEVLIIVPEEDTNRHQDLSRLDIEMKEKRDIPSEDSKKLLLRDPKDIELLLMNNRTHAGEISHSISAKKRVDILNRAKELNVRIINPSGKVRKTPSE